MSVLRPRWSFRLQLIEVLALAIGRRDLRQKYLCTPPNLDCYHQNPLSNTPPPPQLFVLYQNQADLRHRQDNDHKLSFVTAIATNITITISSTTPTLPSPSAPQPIFSTNRHRKELYHQHRPRHPITCKLRGGERRKFEFTIGSDVSPFRLTAWAAEIPYSCWYADAIDAPNAVKSSPPRQQQQPRRQRQ